MKKRRAIQEHILTMSDERLILYNIITTWIQSANAAGERSECDFQPEFKGCFSNKIKTIPDRRVS